MNDNSIIYVGQRLSLPENGNTSAQTSATTTPSAQPAQSAQSNDASATSSNYNANATSNNTASANTTTTTSVSGDDSSAKAWIANRESGGSYTATNGQYVGKYQLSSSYLNGDYSAANQEKVADSYVASRYGSWSAAKSFWESHGWY